MDNYRIIRTDELVHAGKHKYIDKKWANGKWQYIYDKPFNNDKKTYEKVKNPKHSKEYLEEYNYNSQNNKYFTKTENDSDHGTSYKNGSIITKKLNKVRKHIDKGSSWIKTQLRDVKKNTGGNQKYSKEYLEEYKYNSRKNKYY